MPDICMCNGGNCPIKNKCYRYRAIPDDCLQSYFLKAPYSKITRSCDHFASIEGWDERNLTPLPSEVASSASPANQKEE